MPESINFCALTDTGLKRKKNDDCFLIVADGESGFPVSTMGAMFAVADGMGGHPAGDKAARMACDVFRDCYYGVHGLEKAVCLISRIVPFLSCRLLLKRMATAMTNADRAIQDYECNHKKCEGLGTTLSVLVLTGGRALISHVGDSRIYRLRQGSLKLCTVDHTFVQDLVDMGEMTREEADESPMRHVLMEALGRGVDELYISCEKVHRGDIFLLCSDGLNDMINDKSILQALNADTDIHEKCARLVKNALEAGGKDNVTVIVVQLT